MVDSITVSNIRQLIPNSIPLPICIKNNINKAATSSFTGKQAALLASNQPVTTTIVDCLELTNWKKAKQAPTTAECLERDRI